MEIETCPPCLWQVNRRRIETLIVYPFRPPEWGFGVLMMFVPGAGFPLEDECAFDWGLCQGEGARVEMKSKSIPRFREKSKMKFQY